MSDENKVKIARIQAWITDRSLSPQQGLDLATEIHDLCEMWIDALQHDTAAEAAKEEAK